MLLTLLVGVLGLGMSSAPAPAAAPSSGGTQPDFRGTVAIQECSGAIVRWEHSRPRDKAVMLSNGHCHSHVPIGPRAVLVDKTDSRQVLLRSRAGKEKATVRTSRLVYATRFRTDVALYELRLTYRQLRRRHHVRALLVADRRPSIGAPVTIPSGWAVEEFRCQLRAQVFHLDVGETDWFGSLRLGKECTTYPGTSGSPILDAERAVIGINNAVNGTSGKRCTAQLACEKDRDGKIKVFRGRGYGQQTWWLTTCIGRDRELHLRKDGCRLPKRR